VTIHQDQSQIKLICYYLTVRHLSSFTRNTSTYHPRLDIRGDSKAKPSEKQTLPRNSERGLGVSTWSLWGWSSNYERQNRTVNHIIQTQQKKYINSRLNRDTKQKTGCKQKQLGRVLLVEEEACLIKLRRQRHLDIFHREMLRNVCTTKFD